MRNYVIIFSCAVAQFLFFLANYIINVSSDPETNIINANESCLIAIFFAVIVIAVSLFCILEKKRKRRQRLCEK